MKDFLKFTFASVIGVILAGVVFTILGIITLTLKAVYPNAYRKTHSNNFWGKNLRHTVWMTF